ncbi:NupC/NupG family nucleoside CNT transporter [bacterium]|nr:NupC/NupG family nucleoside CNT transporter [bacterium]
MVARYEQVCSTVKRVPVSLCVIAPRIASLIGVSAFLGLGYLFSVNRAGIKLRQILTAFAFQIGIAAFMLKTSIGVSLIGMLAGGVAKLYSFADIGARFVFGGLVDCGPWGVIVGIKLIIAIVFFGALTSLLFYLGVVQFFVRILAKLISPVLGTSGAETLCASANSMLGQIESPMLVKNYLENMTDSEMFVVMVSGFSTLSAGIVAVYGSMGISLNHLLTASIMSIPGALLMSKIMFPEDSTPETAAGELTSPKVSDASSVLDAFAGGAVEGMAISINIVAILLVFVGAVAMADSVIRWSTAFAIGKTITLNSIFGAFFSGFAWLMGIPCGELFPAGALLGKKLVINEFIAYANVATAGLGERAVTIITYALCGFANFSCVGIQIGGIGALAPSQRGYLVKYGVLALGAGTLVNFLNAAIVGFLL